jgi:hypothetical protein
MIRYDFSKLNCQMLYPEETTHDRNNINIVPSLVAWTGYPLMCALYPSIYASVGSTPVNHCVPTPFYPCNHISLYRCIHISVPLLVPL